MHPPPTCSAVPEKSSLLLGESSALRGSTAPLMIEGSECLLRGHCGWGTHFTASKPVPPIPGLLYLPMASNRHCLRLLQRRFNVFLRTSPFPFRPPFTHFAPFLGATHPRTLTPSLASKQTRHGSWHPPRRCKAEQGVGGLSLRVRQVRVGSFWRCGTCGRSCNY
jgi:hypothetical protein